MRMIVHAHMCHQVLNWYASPTALFLHQETGPRIFASALKQSGHWLRAIVHHKPRAILSWTCMQYGR